MSDGDALFASAMKALTSGDLGKARRLLRCAAEAEHIPALTTYATWVEHGVGGRPHPHEALAWHRRAAELGDPAACLRVAEWHADRHQIPQAKNWLRKSSAPQARLAEIRLDVRSRSCRTTSAVRSWLSQIAGEPALSAAERREVEALIALYGARRPDVNKATEGRDRMREAKRRTRG